MSSHRYAVTTLLCALVFTHVGLTTTRADLIADPEDLTGYVPGDRIGEAFPGMTLSVGAINWASLGSRVQFATGQATLDAYTPGDPSFGWELGTHDPSLGLIYNSVRKFGSQHVAGSYSADAIILVVRLDEPTDRVWADISNPGGSSNHHIALTAFDDDGEELGLRMGSIGRELTRVEYTHPTPDITIFSVDIGGGFWSYPIDAVGAGVIPEPSTLLLCLGAFALLSFRRRNGKL